MVCDEPSLFVNLTAYLTALMSIRVDFDIETTCQQSFCLFVS